LIGNFGRESPVNLSWVSLEISDQIGASSKCIGVNNKRKYFAFLMCSIVMMEIKN
jgi:hypothetical protein